MPLQLISPAGLPDGCKGYELHHEICLGHVCRQRRNALAGSLDALTGAAEYRNSGVQSATAWRTVTCGSSDHGLPALRDEPILGFRAREFHRTVAPELPFPVLGAAQSDAGRGTRAVPGVHSFHGPRVGIPRSTRL